MKPNSANNTSEIKMIHHTEQFCKYMDAYIPLHFLIRITCLKDILKAAIYISTGDQHFHDVGEVLLNY